MQKIDYPLAPHHKILLLRVQQGLSIRNLSRLSGVHAVKLYRIEFGLSELRLDAAQKIIRSLDTSPEELATSYWEATPRDCWVNQVGAKCLHIRKQNQIKLKTVSRATNISMSSLCRLESGECPNPTFMLIKQISDYYQVAISWLMGYNNN